MSTCGSASICEIHPHAFDRLNLSCICDNTHLRSCIESDKTYISYNYVFA
jgi:hypothetical protein